MSSANRLYTLSDLSARFELELQGDGNHRIRGVGTLANATASEIAFLANPAYRKYLAATKAGAVILTEANASSCPTNCLVAPDPYVAYARLASLFELRPAAAPGVHPTAVVAESARLGRDVSVGPQVVIGHGCEVADGCTIGPGCVLEDYIVLGPGCRLHANVSIGYGVRIGQRVIIHPGAVIGADGFGIAFAGDHWEKVPQLGSVLIGDDCEVGANTCIDRGAVGDTVLEQDVRIDNLCQIAHNAHIGAHTAMAGNAGVAGSTKIGRYCLIGGSAGIAGHLEIADRTTVGAGSNVFESINEPGQTWSTYLPAQPLRDWQRNLARLRRLDELARKVQNLKKQVENKQEDE